MAPIVNEDIKAPNVEEEKTDTLENKKRGYTYMEGGNGDDTYIIDNIDTSFTVINDNDTYSGNGANENKIQLNNVNGDDLVLFFDVTIDDKKDSNYDNSLYIMKKSAMNSVMTQMEKFIDALYEVYGKDDFDMHDHNDQYKQALKKGAPQSGGVMVEGYFSSVSEQNAHGYINEITTVDKNGIEKTLDVKTYIEKVEEKVKAFLQGTSYKSAMDGMFNLSSAQMRELFECYSSVPINCTVKGTDNNDTIKSSAGDDEIYGGAGNDTIYGGAGNDTITGGEGDDKIYIDGDTDTIKFTDKNESNNGNDTVYFTKGTAVLDFTDITDVKSFEDLTFSTKGNDLIIYYGEDGESVTLSGYLANKNKDNLVDVKFSDDTTEELYDYLNSEDFKGFELKGTDGKKNTITGTALKDDIEGQELDDTLKGADGNDIIDGKGGNDKLYGDAGDDTIKGGEGDDTIYGGAGNDTITGGAGNDKIYIDGDKDTIHFEASGNGNDTVYFTKGTAVLDFTNITGVTSFNNLTFSTKGNDLIISYGSNGESVTLSGYLANKNKDELVDVKFGDNNSEKLSTYLSSSEFKGFELKGTDGKKNTITGTALKDNITGEDLDDTLKGGDGNDIIDGKGGNDKLYGDAGEDTINGGDGNDTIYGGAGEDTIDGGAGDDKIYIDGDKDTIKFTKESGNDTLYFSKGTATLDFSSIEDITSAENLTFSVKGNDLIISYNNGNTVTLSGYLANKNKDSLVDLKFSNGDTTKSLSEYLSSPEFKGFKLEGDTEKKNTITGSALKDIIEGKELDDTLKGGDGNDTINGGAGNDKLYGDAGNDTIKGDDGDDTIYGGAGNDEIYGGKGNDKIYADGDEDTIYFEESENGNDTIYSGKGTATLDFSKVTSVTDFNKLKFTVSGKDLVITYGDNNTITLSGYMSNPKTHSAQKVKFNNEKEAESLYEYLNDEKFEGIKFDGAEDKKNTITGTALKDIIDGKGLDDTLKGGDGNDIIDGKGGNDKLYGDAGNDTIKGDEGDDTIYGGAGNDEIYGGKGNDKIYVDGDTDTIYFEDNGGNDTIYSGKGTATLDFSKTTNVTEFKNLKFSVSGKDLVITYGDSNTITLSGYMSNPENHSVKNVKFKNGNSQSLQDYLNSENFAFETTGTPGKKNSITGTSIRDNITGQELDDTIKGGDGNDTINGAGGNDKLYGDAGDDTIKGGEGDDTIYGGAGDDKIYGESGNNSFYIDGGNDTVYFDGNNKGNADIVYSGKGSATLDFSSVTDNAHFEFLEFGNDLAIYFGDGIDKNWFEQYPELDWDEVEFEGNMVVLKNYLADPYNHSVKKVITPNGEEKDLLEYLQKENTFIFKGDEEAKNSITGTKVRDIITGGNQADTLKGSDGNDTINGGAGNDTIYGGNHDDDIYGGQGDDKLYGDAGNDAFYFKAGDGEDIVYSGTAGDEDLIVLDKNLEENFKSEKGLQFAGKGNFVPFSRNGNDLIISYGNGDQITLKDFCTAKGHTVKGLAFAEFADDNISSVVPENTDIDFSKFVTQSTYGHREINFDNGEKESFNGQVYTGDDTEGNYVITAKGNKWVDTGKGNDYVFLSSGKSFVEDKGGNDTYVVSDLSAATELFDYGGDNDKLIVQENSDNIHFIFDIEEHGELFILNDNDYNNLLKGKYNYTGTIISGYFDKSSNDSTPGTIETIVTADGKTITADTINKIKSQVESWLDEKGYSSAFDVLEGGNSDDINALLAIYEKWQNPEQLS